ncbi:unnamed protein product [Lepidochelys kempii]
MFLKKQIFSCLCTEQDNLAKAFKSFYKQLSKKWEVTVTHSMSPEAFHSKSSFWKVIGLLDPHCKSVASDDKFKRYAHVISPFVASNKESAKLESEFCAYMAMPSLDSHSIMPLEFGKIHCTNFPTLSHVASRILSIPPGSADLERVFSKFGYIQDCRRTGLGKGSLKRLLQTYATQDFWKLH